MSSIYCMGEVEEISKTDKITIICNSKETTIYINKINNNKYICSKDELIKIIESLTKLLLKQDNTEEIINNIITSIGMNTNLEGTKNLICAIELIYSKLKNEKDITKVKEKLSKLNLDKEIYLLVATKNKTTKYAVERSIRYATTQTKADPEEIIKIFNTKYNKETGSISNKNLIIYIILKIIEIKNSNN